MEKLLLRAGVKKAEIAPSRSEYSLVVLEPTPGILSLWSGLPEIVKQDLTFHNFQQKPEVNGSNVRLEEVLDVAREEAVGANAREDSPFARKLDRVEKDNGEELHSLDAKKIRPPTMLALAGHYAKMASLLAAWLFFTVVFMLYGEREAVVRHSFLKPGEHKRYFINDSDCSRMRVNLQGPFLSEQAEAMSKSRNISYEDASTTVEAWLEKWEDSEGKTAKRSESWLIMLLDAHLIDFSLGESRSKVLQIAENETSPVSRTVLNFQSSVNFTMPISLAYVINPIHESTGVICAAILLIGLYVLIISEIINRTLAAVISSSCALAVLAVAGERPGLLELVSWLDVETLLLLFSMMLLVAITAETGLFDFLAVFTFSVTKGKVWPLINLLCFFTAILSTFLDNVTTVLLMAPVTIRLCELMELNPVPILIAMVIYSNIGGTATPVGDPPNVIIASNHEVIESGIHFGNFTTHMTVGILLICVQTYIQLRFIYRDHKKLRIRAPKDVQELQQQIAEWKRAAGSLGSHSRDEDAVRGALEHKIEKLEQKLKTLSKQRKKRAVPLETFNAMLKSLQDKNKIRDRKLLIKATASITFVVVVFFLHSLPELKRISLGWTALLGAILLLILADREDIENVLARVEWSTLLFFAALFVFMEALSKLGLIQWIGSGTESLILCVNERWRLAVAIVLIVWVSGIVSAFIDNIPLTTMMIRIATSIGQNKQLGLPMAPLIWALSFGANLGGNATLIGASANVVTAGVAQQHGYRLSFREFFAVGFPIMVGHLLVTTAYLLICHCLFEWH